MTFTTPRISGTERDISSITIYKHLTVINTIIIIIIIIDT